MGRIREYLNAAFSLDGTLSTRDTKQRKLLFTVTGLCVSFLTPFLASYMVTEVMSLLSIGIVFCVAGNLTMFVMILRHKEVNPAMLSCPTAAGILILDLYQRGTLHNAWPALIIIVDFLLVMRVSRRHAVLFVWAAVLWLVINMFEASFRFGLFDAPLTVPQETRRESIAKWLDCDAVPCPSDLSKVMGEGVMGISVFVIDFVATRGFAEAAQREQAAMEHTIKTVQDISVLLASYDIDTVRDTLAQQISESSSERVLPQRMHDALTTLEKNLRSYRPYLPEALFEELYRKSEAQCVPNLVPPPGVHDSCATIAFTDVLASTSIWEAAPTGMRDALKMHNSALRLLIDECSGYEVKTIGDAFMVAFNTAASGVRFGMVAHQRLLSTTWPATLFHVPICTQHGSMWGGLTIRVGINSGSVALEQNVLTGRVDYFGHTVNVAARLEAGCTPGSVTLPSTLWDSVCDEIYAVTSAPELLELRGVSEPMQVCSVWPPQLAQRQHFPIASCSLQQGSVRAIPSTSLCTKDNGARSATIAVADISVGDGTDDMEGALHNLSGSLESISPMLNQSGGALVTLLGSCVCVGWNISSVNLSHAESALRFARRLLVAEAPVLGLGVASGLVVQGDVGSSNQRFMTVLGDAVKQGWRLCDTAVTTGQYCLYSPPQGTVLPASLVNVLLIEHTEGVFKMVEETEEREM